MVHIRMGLEPGLLLPNILWSLSDIEYKSGESKLLITEQGIHQG